MKNIRQHKTWIAGLWLAVLSMSFSLMLTHQHHHIHQDSEHCHHSNNKEQTTHQHEDADCTYCFLYYHQLVSQAPTYSWVSNPGEFDRNLCLSTELPAQVMVKRYYSKGLRAPPVLENS
ncbi:hypothetical protein GQF61_09535 [Sphingobacterium sp. DK4209]|uniref:DUF2946 domain-containing protein n=1 Tax=Sphingobacterium zhuxiongii TaxID=2662364 RepID=A0A5Q0QBH5_9SPHI|nr:MULTISPECIES: hypothetical protein [unclassified Sphingobacterium]MVZ66098.1 hypothetical protein [Sphingobacterium sp. DK4209]QGA26519.1 hypothetical protein GFH32_09365 [Sphingobacterium sp. dk4302]